jgi:hypothetical protein
VRHLSENILSLQPLDHLILRDTRLFKPVQAFLHSLFILQLLQMAFTDAVV